MHPSVVIATESIDPLFHWETEDLFRLLLVFAICTSAALLVGGFGRRGLLRALLAMLAAPFLLIGGCTVALESHRLALYAMVLAAMVFATLAPFSVDASASRGRRRAVIAIALAPVAAAIYFVPRALLAFAAVRALPQEVLARDAFALQAARQIQVQQARAHDAHGSYLAAANLEIRGALIVTDAHPPGPTAWGVRVRPSGCEACVEILVDETGVIRVRRGGNVSAGDAPASDEELRAMKAGEPARPAWL